LKSLKAILSNDFVQIATKRKLFIFFTALFIGFLFLQYGSCKYQSIKEGKTLFQETEKLKVNSYSRISQYGGYGVRLMFLPAKSSILSDKFNYSVESTVNSAHLLDLFKSTKGQNFYYKNIPFMNFSGVLLLLFSLLSLLFGIDITAKLDYLKLKSAFGFQQAFLLSVFSRMIFIIAIFFLFIVLSFLLLLISSGANLFESFSLYLALTLILVCFFYFFVGLFAGTIITKINRWTFIGVVYFTGMLFIPWIGNIINNINLERMQSIHRYELDNFKIYMDLEKRLEKRFGTFISNGKNLAPEELIKEAHHALEEEFKEFSDREKQRKETFGSKIAFYQIFSSFFPTNFYMSVDNEISSLGGKSLLEFYSFSQVRKKEFVNYYVGIRFLKKSKPKDISGFIKNDGNIFYSKPRLPHSFTLGIALTVFYILFLFTWTRKRLLKNLHPSAANAPNIIVEKGSTVFVLCENITIKKSILDYYRMNENVTVVEKINPAEFPVGLSAQKMVKHFAKLTGIRPQDIENNLDILTGGASRDTVPGFETIKKIYAAVICAHERETIVVDDFLKRESRDFEKDFIELLIQFEKKGKRILYLSCEFYETANNLKDKIKIQKFKPYAVDLDKVTLR
jgi:hypothetical protein